MNKPLLPLDVEASSLSDVSWPCEIGWVKIDPADGSFLTEPQDWLVRPVEQWTDWDEASEAIHGLALDSLGKDGHEVLKVARSLYEASRDATILVSSPTDRFWIRRLFEAAVGQGFEPVRIDLDIQPFGWTLVRRLRPAIVRQSGSKLLALQHDAQVQINRAQRAAATLQPATHRAMDDALNMAAIWSLALGLDYTPRPTLRKPQHLIAYP